MRAMTEVVSPPTATAPKRKLRDLLPLVLVAFAAAIFCIQAWRQIHFPGLYQDELIQITPAIAFAHPDPDHHLQFTRMSVQGLGRDWPVMIMAYIGAVKTWLFV